MRLLKTKPSQPGLLEFESFYGQELPPYGILSHTWGYPDDEVLYTDIVIGIAPKKAAFDKIQATIRQARQDGYTHCWVDTCCIDKSSSAELSEAINSMWHWYQSAQKCYAYLADVSVDSADSTLHESKWFSRGWTLQELLGPAQVLFYGKEWVTLDGMTDAECSQDAPTALIGTKQSLKTRLADITGIDPTVLEGSREIRSVNIAQRMSWASKRRTTRPEDEAYCLMGLFDVNMPMLYGEGQKAFLRLQEEILKSSVDQSIFVWKFSGPSDEGTGLLAPCVGAFVDCGSITTHTYDSENSNPPWAITNKGLSLTVSLRQYDRRLHLAVFNCRRLGSSAFLAIHLKRLKSYGNQFAKVRSFEVVPTYKTGSMEAIYVRQTPVVVGDPEPALTDHIAEPEGFQALKTLSERNEDHGYVLTDATCLDPMSQPHRQKPPQWTSSHMPTFFKLHSERVSAALLFQNQSNQSQFVLVLGASGGYELRLKAFAEPYGTGFRSLSAYEYRDLYSPLRCPVFRATPRVYVSFDIKFERVPGAECYKISMKLIKFRHAVAKYMEHF